MQIHDLKRLLVATFLFLAPLPALAQINPGPGGGGAPPGTYTGQVGGYDNSVFNSPTVTASAYTLNNAIGGLQTVAAFRTTAQPSGVLDYIQVTSKGGITTSMTIYGFEKSPASTCTDKSAFVLSSTDLPYLIPGFPITITPAALNGTTQTIGSQSLVTSTKNADSAATVNLYFCAVINGTPTPASTTDLTFHYALVDD